MEEERDLAMRITFETTKPRMVIVFDDIDNWVTVFGDVQVLRLPLEQFVEILDRARANTAKDEG